MGSRSLFIQLQSQCNKYVNQLQSTSWRWKQSCLRSLVVSEGWAYSIWEHILGRLEETQQGLASRRRHGPLLTPLIVLGECFYDPGACPLCLWEQSMCLSWLCDLTGQKTWIFPWGPGLRAIVWLDKMGTTDGPWTVFKKAITQHGLEEVLFQIQLLITLVETFALVTVRMRLHVLAWSSIDTSKLW